MNFLKSLLHYLKPNTGQEDSFGLVTFSETDLEIKDYPFEPSNIHEKARVSFAAIDKISLSPLNITTGKEVLFLDKKYTEALKKVAESNEILVDESISNWGLIAEPFLDQEMNDERMSQNMSLLEERGISKDETKALEIEIQKAMMAYNFDSMRWQWAYFEFDDVLVAMQAKLNTEAFKSFYWKAMAIELRG